MPDFQRGWVWEDERVRSLLVSVARSFPVGMVILLETGGDARFQTRPVENVEFGGMKSIRQCTARYDLDLETLIWTRGGAFPISMLSERLKCPRCGSRHVALMFNLPGHSDAKRAKAGALSDHRIRTSSPYAFGNQIGGARAGASPRKSRRVLIPNVRYRPKD